MEVLRELFYCYHRYVHGDPYNRPGSDGGLQQASKRELPEIVSEFSSNTHIMGAVHYFKPCI